MQGHSKDTIELSVSNHGMRDGLSSLRNDGADFGLDSIDSNSMTKTDCVQEAIAYAHATQSGQVQIRLAPGCFQFCEEVLLEGDIEICGDREVGSLVMLSVGCKSAFSSTNGRSITLECLYIVTLGDSFGNAPESCIDFSQSPGPIGIRITKVTIKGTYRRDILRLSENAGFLIDNLIIEVSTLGNSTAVGVYHEGNLVLNSSFSIERHRLKYAIFRLVYRNN